MPKLVLISLSVGAIALLTACRTVAGACEKTCDQAIECADAGDAEQSVSECVSECMEDIESVPEDCQGDYVDVAYCISGKSCEELEEDDALLDCVSGVSLSCFLNDDDEDCCDESDPCDWAEDNFCDCGGTTSWDTVDCAL